MVTIPWECTRRRASLKTDRTTKFKRGFHLTYIKSKWPYQRHPKLLTRFHNHVVTEIHFKILQCKFPPERDKARRDNVYSCYIATENRQSFQTSEIVHNGLGSIWNNHCRYLFFWKQNKMNKSLRRNLWKFFLKKIWVLPSILANKSSKITMSFRIVDSLCHFLFMEYGQ